MKDDENIENEVEDLSLNSGLYIEKGPWMILKLPSTFFVLNKTEIKKETFQMSNNELSCKCISPLTVRRSTFKLCRCIGHKL